MGEAIPPADLIILPGSKNVRADLAYLRARWEQVLTHHLRYGGKLLGICGGFQMLGVRCTILMQLKERQGLRRFWLASMETTLQDEAIEKQSWKLVFADATVTGYEIHMGVSTGEASKNRADIDGKPEGAMSQDNQIAGTYLHGLFDEQRLVRRGWLGGFANRATFSIMKSSENDEFNRLADCVEQHLNWEKLAGHIKCSRVEE